MNQQQAEQHTVGPADRQQRWYSHQELTAIIRTLNDPHVALDPRFELLMHAGAGFHLGVVIQARRRDLNLEAGTLRIHGFGTWRGVVRTITGALHDRVESVLATGYLSDLEEAYRRADIEDYAVFPAGKLRGGESRTDGGRGLDSASSSWLRRHFLELEKVAGVKHTTHRGWLGIRHAIMIAMFARGVPENGIAAAFGVRSWNQMSLLHPDTLRMKGQQALDALLQELADDETP